MKNTTCSFITGVLVGAAAGVIAGVLYAPDKGSETRKKIKDNADHVGQDIKSKFEDLQQQVNDVLSHLKGDTKEEKPAAKRGRKPTRKTT